VLQITFYASLILVPYEVIEPKSEALAAGLLINPLAAIIQESRHLIIDPAYVSASDGLGAAALLIVPLALLLGSVALGLWVFNREAPRIAEEL